MSFVPVTPGGTPLIGLAAKTEDLAINRLLIDAAHMPYGTWENFEHRGYSIEEYPDEMVPPLKNPDWAGCGGQLTHAEKDEVLKRAGR